MKVFWPVLVPSLLASSVALAQDPTPHFALSLGGGVAAFNLPSGQNGVQYGGNAQVTGTNGQWEIGETANISGAIDLGTINNLQTFLGISAFGTYANGNFASTQNFSGEGFVAIPGLSTPSNASITLNTSRGPGSASAGVSANDTTPQGDVLSDTSSANSGGTQTAAFVDTPGSHDSFIMGGSNAQASSNSTALAYAGIADSSGNIFIATGDLDGLSISTSTRNTVLYSGLDLTLGVGGNADDKTSVQAYAGPSYRNISQWNSTTSSLTVDIPEVDPATVTHPLYILDRNGSVMSNYFGGVIGTNISHQVNDALSVSLGAEGSLYYATAHLTGSDTATTTGGSGAVVGGSPTVTVADTGVSKTQSTLAYAVRGQAAATVALSPNISLTSSVAADYLSAVARPYGNASVAYSNGNAVWASGDSPLSFGGMFTYTANLSLTGRF